MNIAINGSLSHMSDNIKHIYVIKGENYTPYGKIL